ncbi:MULTISPECIES: hypothetical protein [Helicobacter]|uniref:Uncharacterized protein n=1 Tax=Helicobacter fennelliae TaxID=215 RepID=A0A2X3BB95_9HELI|nr:MULTISPECIES: hypothetical protein [Helicobacter]AWK62396.1 hypothetical protein C6B36_08650 [Helicobacter cinaedi]QOQ96967.1 hypothetical protein HW245_04865 [Helicobacter cinaedi]SQB98151.1 Uncharacterised protein [Helicobacter fennelliae]BAM12959.1 hypothetical protein HCN_1790 [Helicobacter cinaedi PAGU611]BBB20849.1 hypothetical protein HC081234_20260 [Helicobacter cinaedi]
MSGYKSTMKGLYDRILGIYNRNKYENYREQEKVIENIFSENGVFAKLGRENLQQIVLLKVSVLDSFYSTNLAKFGIYEVAKHITELEQKDQIHQKIRNANPQNYNELKDIVKQIAECKRKDDKKKVFYSFATKYCFHHNQNAFRIYDSFVREVLVFFNNGKSDTSNKFADIPSELVGTNFYGKKLTNKELKDYDTYDTFLQAIDEFAKHYGLENKDAQDRRKLDHFLWILGKEKSEAEQ